MARRSIDPGKSPSAPISVTTGDDGDERQNINLQGATSNDLTTQYSVQTQPHDRTRQVLDIMPAARFLVGTNKVVSSNGSTTLVNSIAHVAKRGDLILFETLSANAGQAAYVVSTTADSFTVGQPFTAATTSGDTYTIYRPSQLLTDSSGALSLASASFSISSPTASNAPPIGSTGLITREVGSVDDVYGGFSTPYNYRIIGGYDQSFETFGPLPLCNFNQEVAVALFDATGNALGSLNSAPSGAERALLVRQVGQISSNTAQINGVAPSMGNGASGTGVQRVTICSDSTGQIIVLGNVAHDGVDSGAPAKIGFRARTSQITAVANDDRVDGIADKRGRQVILINALQEDRFKGSSSADIVNTTSTAVVAAGGAGVIYVITAISVSNMSATVSTRVDILDGSTVIWRGPAASGGGGFTITFPDGLVCTANTAINAQCATTGAAVRVSVAGHKVS